MLRTIITALLLSVSHLSYADCEVLTGRLNKALGYPDSAAATEGWFVNCKVWPADPSKSIVAFAHFQKGSSVADPTPGNGLYDLDVLVVKTDSGEILHHLLQTGALPSDANYLNGITIDTARYDLTPRVRAFGVRADFNHSGGVNIHAQTINLYVTQGATLKQVLGNLITINNHSEQHYNCWNASEISRTLAIANTSSHAYADLVLQEKAIIREVKMVNNDCEETEKPPYVRRYTLRFDGTKYVIPKELQY